MEKDAVAIVVAAGEGSRIGGPKALLLVNGEPLALAHARRALEAGCHSVAVVVRPEVLPKVPPMHGVRFLTSTAMEQAGTLAVAVEALRLTPTTVVLITPVDAVPAHHATIELLMRSLGPALAATPSFSGKSGHPIVCRASVLAPYRRRSPTPPPLNAVLQGLGAERIRVQVEDPAVITDLDTPEDIRAVTGGPPCFVA